MGDPMEKIYPAAKAVIENAGGMARRSALVEAGLPDKDLRLLIDAEKITRVKSGYYGLPGETLSEIERVALMFPDGVLTMGSALYYHGYLPQRPREWSVAVSKNTSKSRFKVDDPPLAPYYTEPEILPLGVEEMPLTETKGDDRTIKVYSVDRLICDVLKFEERLSRQDFRTAAFAYINDETKDVAKLLEYAEKRRVRKKVQNMIGVWL